MENKTDMYYDLDDKSYKSENGFIIKREFGETPNGNKLDGQWVLRSSSGQFIDFKKYRHDLAEKYKFNLLAMKVNSNLSPNR